MKHAQYYKHLELTVLIPVASAGISGSPAAWPEGSGDCLLSVGICMGTAIWLRSMVCCRGLASAFSFADKSNTAVCD